MSKSLLNGNGLAKAVTKQFQHFITFGMAFREVKCMSQKAFSAGAYHCWVHWHFISLTCILCAVEMLQISLRFFCFFFLIQSPGDGKHSIWENPAQKLFVHHFTSAQTCWICFANRRRRKTHCFKNQFLIATFFSNDKQGWNFSFMILGNECI